MTGYPRISTVKEDPPDFFVSSRVADLEEHRLPKGSVQRLCSQCAEPAWLSPSSLGVERDLGRQVPLLCQQCYASRATPRDIAIVAGGAFRELADLARRKKS